jgi:hypothetical protein
MPVFLASMDSIENAEFFPPFHDACKCFEFNPIDLNRVITISRLSYHVKWPLPPGDNRNEINKFYYNCTTQKDKNKCHKVWHRGPIPVHRDLVTCSEFNTINRYCRDLGTSCSAGVEISLLPNTKLLLLQSSRHSLGSNQISHAQGIKLTANLQQPIPRLRKLELLPFAQGLFRPMQLVLPLHTLRFQSQK